MLLLATVFVLHLQAFAVVPTYTGCYSATSGTINKLAVGVSPQKACNSGDIMVSFSSGDVTKISVTGGLTGGGDNGDVTISLNPAYSLPQNCSANLIAKWTGSAWSCAADENTTYTNGVGISLSGTDNSFSILPGYRLPQGCGDGTILKATASGWSCATPPGKPHAYAASGEHFLGDFTLTDIVALTVPSGNYVVFGKVELENSDFDSQEADCEFLVDGTQVEVFQTRLGAAAQADSGIGREIGIPHITWGTVNHTVSITCKTYYGYARGKVTAIPVDSIN